METLDVEKANQVAWNIARNVQERYGEYSTVDDLSQEVWLWIVENQEQVLGWEEEEWISRLYRRGYRIANALARRDRAQTLGYEPRDEFFYSLSMLRRLLPLYFEEGLDPDEVVLPDRDVALDFDRAFPLVDGESCSLLHYIYYGDTSEDRTRALAAMEGVSEDAARMKVQRALTRLRTALGGPNPHGSGRTVLSNAQAAAITRRQYGD